ncbi:hypothetical protein [Rhodococcus sp. NPDC127528]
MNTAESMCVDPPVVAVAQGFGLVAVPAKARAAADASVLRR